MISFACVFCSSFPFHGRFSLSRFSLIFQVLCQFSISSFLSFFHVLPFRSLYFQGPSLRVLLSQIFSLSSNSASLSLQVLFFFLFRLSLSQIFTFKLYSSFCLGYSPSFLSRLPFFFYRFSLFLFVDSLSSGLSFQVLPLFFSISPFLSFLFSFFPFLGYPFSGFAPPFKISFSLSPSCLSLSLQTRTLLLNRVYTFRLFFFTFSLFHSRFSLYFCPDSPSLFIFRFFLVQVLSFKFPRFMFSLFKFSFTLYLTFFSKLSVPFFAGPFSTLSHQGYLPLFKFSLSSDSPFPYLYVVSASPQVLSFFPARFSFSFSPGLSVLPFPFTAGSLSLDSLSSDHFSGSFSVFNFFLSRFFFSCSFFLVFFSCSLFSGSLSSGSLTSGPFFLSLSLSK